MNGTIQGGGKKNQDKQKKVEYFVCKYPTFRSRGRTGTGVNLLVFETSASTDSAIRADFVKIENRVQM